MLKLSQPLKTVMLNELANNLMLMCFICNKHSVFWQVFLVV